MADTRAPEFPKLKAEEHDDLARRADVMAESSLGKPHAADWRQLAENHRIAAAEARAAAKEGKMSDVAKGIRECLDTINKLREENATQAAEITRLRAEQGKARGYLSRLLQSLYPSIEILPDMLGVCTQIDNVLAGQREEITRLRAEVATARREGMEEAADLCDNLPDHQGGICAIAIRMMIDEEDKKAAIRAAAKEEK